MHELTLAQSSDVRVRLLPLPRNRAVTMPCEISCTCGRAALEFAHEGPVRRLLCGCCDCRQAMQWAESKGGPTAPHPLSDLYYLFNDCRVIRGGDTMVWVKLRADGRSARCIARCCYSTLAVDHPNYGARVVMIFADASHMGGVCEREVDGRVYLQDLSQQDRDGLPAFEGPSTGLGGDDAAAWEAIRALTRDPCPLPRRWGPIQEIAAGGTGVEVLGLEEAVDPRCQTTVQ